jgi:hypothetical protein
MRLAIASLFFFLCALPAPAAPAPFQKPTKEPEPDALREQLKQHLLRQHGAYADHINATSDPRVFHVIGNTPVVTGGGQLVYEQRFYRVTFSAADRRGNVRFESEAVVRQRRMVITR